VKFINSLWNIPLEEVAVAPAVDGLFHHVDLPGRLAVHGRVDVAEVPLVRGNLAVRVEVHLVGDQAQLLLGEVDVHPRQDHAVKREIPRGEPGILPLVGHREDVGALEKEPLLVSRRHTLLAVQRQHLVLHPLAHGVVVELLAPQHARERLSHDQTIVVREARGNDGRVEFVRLAQPGGQQISEPRPEGVHG
jgi:hypothetical protein